MSEKDKGHANATTRRRPWWGRPSVRTLRTYYQTSRSTAEIDAMENDDSRLAEGETIQFAAVTVVEAFTPSTVDELRKALERWDQNSPISSTRRSGELIELLENSRSLSHNGGWASLGHVGRRRNPLPFYRVDESLPSDVDQAVLAVSFVTPSVAVVTATFYFVDGAGDLSAILRADRRGRQTDARVIVSGRFGRLRSRLPFARPAKHGFSSSWLGAFQQKQADAAALSSRLEDACVVWLRGQFPGRFAALPIERHPLVRMVVTEKTVPFTVEGRGRAAEDVVGVGGSQRAYRAEDGWAISPGGWPAPVRKNCWIMANRRAEAAAARTDGDKSGSNAAIVGWATAFRHDLPAALALWTLIDVFSRELANVRDRRRGRRASRPRRPVRDARELNDYLLSDGLDTATVTADIAKASEGRWLLHDASKFLADAPRKESPSGHKPANFMRGLRKGLVARADALQADSINTADNLRGSAELQQAIANTLLQRAVLVLTVAAIVIALASLVVAI